ncbi:MAG TPA: geranylgeranylglyceryl/heptaprenylglyceryl phosphate synthase [Microscillaceae bacterium]|nr:geranylgeranylglyceryl/heptaprenylglyceryl phosphate synthase [Microscillaceae bacterium]
MNVLELIKTRKDSGKKTLALLIDPDKYREEDFLQLKNLACFEAVDILLVGGSLIVGAYFSQTVQSLKLHCPGLPLVIFPGSNMHLDASADGILFLSLISGRNPDLLIGQHVVVAPILKKSQLEILPTGYMLIEGGKQTTVSYISNTTPIPADKPEIAACTAMAGEMLGLQMIYADAGSGAQVPITSKMVQFIRRAIQVPLWIGGGIRTPQKALELYKAGADVLVLGNIGEENRVTLEAILAQKKKLVE